MHQAIASGFELLSHNLPHLHWCRSFECGLIMKCYRKSESEIERERERVQERQKEENDENLEADLV